MTKYIIKNFFPHKTGWPNSNWEWSLTYWITRTMQQLSGRLLFGTNRARDCAKIQTVWTTTGYYKFILWNNFIYLYRHYESNSMSHSVPSLVVTDIFVTNIYLRRFHKSSKRPLLQKAASHRNTPQISPKSFLSSEEKKTIHVDDSCCSKEVFQTGYCKLIKVSVPFCCA